MYIQEIARRWNTRAQIKNTYKFPRKSIQKPNIMEKNNNKAIRKDAPEREKRRGNSQFPEISNTHVVNIPHAKTGFRTANITGKLVHPNVSAVKKEERMKLVKDQEPHQQLNKVETISDLRFSQGTSSSPDKTVSLNKIQKQLKDIQQSRNAQNTLK